MDVFDQDEFDVRCEWGLRGAERLAPTCDAVIVVDVLSFSTAVSVAVSRGAPVTTEQRAPGWCAAGWRPRRHPAPRGGLVQRRASLTLPRRAAYSQRARNVCGEGGEMAEIPQDLLYSEEHEYLKPAGEEGVYYVGITDHAQSELGDIVYVELPKAGDRFSRNDVFGTVEAVKAAADLYAPISGEVLEVNGALESDPGIVNRDPYGKGWMLKLRAEDEAERDQLLGPEEYASHTGDGSGQR
jgi:glycine cleavage system H protein